MQACAKISRYARVVSGKRRYVPSRIGTATRIGAISRNQVKRSCGEIPERRRRTAPTARRMGGRRRGSASG
jgi:hypothetical protein